MKEFFSKKYQKAKMHFQNLRQKLVVRNWNLGSRVEPQKTHEESKKPKGGR